MSEQQHDTDNLDFIKCPSCGHEDQCSWEFAANSGDIECENCFAKIHYEREMIITYTTTLI